MAERRYPIAEIFFSVQGEGAQSGMAMHFLRLAGCNVGKPYTLEQRQKGGLQVFQNECTTYDGRKFPCDTNYQRSEFLTAPQIIERLKMQKKGCKWVSVTGGEPLVHDILSLVQQLQQEGFYCHLETSGTIEIDRQVQETLAFFGHIVVSPKSPFRDEYTTYANEIRILVDHLFHWDKLPKSIQDASSKVWISPVNTLTEIDRHNAGRCVQIVNDHPEVRISLQIHKLLNVR